jgi:outer membrane protein assembly factor BamE (lipoprotein component of BamABCDE complex)/ketosteroid isomerase-like protein
MKNIVLLIALLCAACSSTIPSIKPYHMDVQQGNVVDSKMLGQLRPGMSKSQVRFILGTPLIQDSFHKNRWDYFYQMRKDGKIIEQRRVILDFENESLKGVRGDVIQREHQAASQILHLWPPWQNCRAIRQESLLDKLRFWKKDEKPLEKASEKLEEKAVVKPQAVGQHTLNAEVEQPLVVAKTPESEPLASPSVAVEAPIAAAAIAESAAPVAEKQPEVATPVATAPAVIAKPVKPATVKPAAVNKTKPAETVVVPMETKAIGEAKLDSTEAVTARVNAWAEAWRKKDINSYLSFYADNFVPESLPNKKVWAAQRKQRLSKPGPVSLVLSGLKVEVDGDKAIAEFLQRYSSQGVTDNVRKVLQLQLVDNNWLITRESAVSALPKPEAAPMAESRAITPTLTSEQKSESLPQPTLQAPVSSTVPAAQEIAQPTPVDATVTSVKPEARAAPEKPAQPEKEVPEDQKPNFFDRMLEKIGF